jgi:hypothetical protein
MAGLIEYQHVATRVYMIKNLSLLTGHITWALCRMIRNTLII